MAIELTTLKSAFGTYLSNNQKNIMRLMMQPTVSQKYMTTIAKTITEYRAAQAVIDDIVQGFTSTWSAKGTPTFTPITITNRRHKINVPFKPDDIVDSWIGFMEDETKTRKDWPISRYIIEKLIIPKVLDNRELKLIGKGIYDVNNLTVTGRSMDGFCTILKKLKTAGTSSINFIDLGSLTTENIVDKINDFVDNIDELYQGVSMPVFLSNTWYKAYKRKYKELYGTALDFTPQSDMIDYSNNRLIQLPSMAGEDIIFTTPKENFIRLINRNEGASNIWIQEQDYSVKVFADWWEAVGFAIEEAVFAYVPDEESSSGSVSA